MRMHPVALCLAVLVAGGACSRNTSQQGSGPAAEGSGEASPTPAVHTQGGRVVLQNKGSDTLVNVAQGWAEGYKTVNAKVAVAVTGGGSGTGISALLNGTADIANSSRKIKDSELAAAKEKGLNPKEHTVGFDALAVYVHKDNPMEKFTIEQLVGIYGEKGTTEKWSQLGVKVPGCDSDEIVRVSRQNNSGTYAYFKEAVLGEQEYKLGSRDMHGSKDVVDLVGKTPCAIGYSGIAYGTAEVRTPCIVKGDQCIPPSMETAIDGSYAIARPLFMYTPAEPSGASKEYIDWILSDAGQCVIKDKGYAPVRDVKCN